MIIKVIIMIYVGIDISKGKQSLAKAVDPEE